MVDQAGNGAQPAEPALTAEDQQGEDIPVRLDVELTGSAQAVPGTLRSKGPEVAERTAPQRTAAEQQALAVAVVQGLDTANQQRIAAEGVVEAIPSEAKQNLAAAVVQSLETPHQQRAAAERVVELLPADQREQLAEGVLGQPDRRTRQRLWYLIIGALIAAIFVFGMMAFILIISRSMRRRHWPWPPQPWAES